MLKQDGMTTEARMILNKLSSVPATAGEIAQETNLTNEHCEFILTQLVMANLAHLKLGCYTRQR